MSEKITKGENKIISIVSNVIEKFIRDWQESPFEYNTEIDIQAEIYSRLVSQLKLHKELILELKYDSIKLQTYKGKMLYYRRAACEYPTYYYKNKKKEHCYPDIIIYRDISNLPPDNKKEINCPMLLVCEIKYETESGGDFKTEKRRSDVKKLKYLLKQRKEPAIHGTEYALFLNFIRKTEVAKKFISLKKLKRGQVRRRDIKPVVYSLKFPSRN